MYEKEFVSHEIQKRLHTQAINVGASKRFAGRARCRALLRSEPAHVTILKRRQRNLGKLRFETHGQRRERYTVRKGMTRAF